MPGLRLIIWTVEDDQTGQGIGHEREGAGTAADPSNDCDPTYISDQPQPPKISGSECLGDRTLYESPKFRRERSEACRPSVLRTHRWIPGL